MNKKDESKIKILSGIDDDIIEKNTEKRFSLWRAAFGKKKRRPRWIPIMAGAACFCILTVAIVLLFPWDNRQVPIYQGMTVSNGTASVAQASDAQELPTAINLSAHSLSVSPMSLSLNTDILLLDNGGGNNGNHYGQNKDGQSESTEAQTEAPPNTYSAEALYYAEKDQDIYITVHIDNPDNFEILSFTLNGEKYSSYMFEQGSDMENLILKVNVGKAEGVVEYTIDAIKYVDGTDIKDVRMDGDRTVKVGVYTDKQPTAKISNIVEDFNSITLDATLSDALGLLALSDGKVNAVLYDGDTKVGEHSLNLGENTGIHFDDLALDTEYRCVIEAEYDNLSGEGKSKYVLLEQTIRTPLALRFDSVTATKTEMSFVLVWNEKYTQQQLTSLSLYQGETKVRDLDISARTVTGLLSNNEYRIVAAYLNGTQPKTVETSILTKAKTTPTLNISSSSSTQDSIGFVLTETDPDEVGAITKIELLHGNDAPIVANSLDVRSFADLFSDNAYTVRVTYVYDLNDGRGEQTVVKTKDIRTQAKTTPTLSISSSSSTQDSIEFVLTETDPDEVGAITKIELLQNGEVIQTKAVGERLLFEGLDPLTEYQLLISYKYDLNNGGGERSISATRYQYSGLNRSQGLAVNNNGEITGIGSCTDKVLYIDQNIYSRAFSGSYNITKVYIGMGVDSIGDSAFSGCGSLTSITIPDGVTEIGDDTFYGCSSLTSITIPDGVTEIGYRAFYGCSSLTSITIPNSVTKIGDDAFEGCSRLTSITIPDGVAEIGDRVFYGCSRLTSITIPNSVTKIRYRAFYGCSSLTSITIPNSVTDIGNDAFEGCSSLTSITIPNSVTRIGDSAFSGCSGLTSITIPDGVTEIGVFAFSNCNSLTSITIPNSVTKIGGCAFGGCSSLTSITIPDGVTEIGSGTFSSCSELTSITIPNSVTIIGVDAFSWCNKLTSITIPDGVTKIGDRAFSECSSLTSITIPDGVAEIGDGVFSGCSSLTSIIIPDSVTEIGSRAFSYCRSLNKIIYQGTVQQWYEIYKTDDVWDGNTGNFTVECTDGTITKANA